MEDPRTPGSAPAVTCEVEINGRTRRVAVERAGGAYVVSLDGQRQVADVTVINGTWSLILGADGVRRSYEITMTEHPPSSGNLSVHVGGRVVSAAVDPRRGVPGRRGHDAGASVEGPRHVTAPMPGKVVRVLVEPGHTVAAKQALVVVEAMKMENELRAPKAGTVSEVRVSEGVSVDAGTVLVVIE